MKILFLIHHDYYLKKMARLRFWAMTAIGKIADTAVSGPGWPDYDNRLSVRDNLKRLYEDKGQSYPDILDVYKPLEIKSFRNVRCPVVMRYNELVAYEWLRKKRVKEILKEIKHCGARLVILHCLTDMPEWEPKLHKEISPQLHCVNIPQGAEKSIFKDYGLPKKWDLLLVGVVNKLYPLRMRLRKIFKTMEGRWRCHVWQHPGYELADAHTSRHVIEYAQAINQAKIACTCSGLPRFRLAKYTEIPMCGTTALAADLPGECHQYFRQFLIELDMSMTDGEIIQKLEYYLVHDDARQALIVNGKTLADGYTYDRYAARYLNAVSSFLNPCGSICPEPSGSSRSS